MGDQSAQSSSGTPYYAVAPQRYWPVATIVLLLLNFAFFALEIYAGGADNTGVLLKLGAAYGPYMRRGEYWRLVMPMFLHGGWMHILGNSYALFILGPIMERVYGYGRYVTIYIASGICCSLLSMSMSKNVAVGASGAIFGLAGAMLVTGYVHRDVIPRRWGRAFGRGMIPFIVITFIWGLSVHGIDNWGHLGGLLGGAVLAFVIPPPRPSFVYGEVTEAPSQAMIVLPVAVVLLAFAATANYYRTTQGMIRLLGEGERFQSAHQYDRARQSFQQALRLAPNEEEPHEAMGMYYLTQRKYGQAVQEFQRAIRLTEGDDDRPRLQLGLAFQLKGDPEKAQQIFEGVFGKNPKSTEGRGLLAGTELQLADLYADQKLYGEAIQAYRQALRLQPDFADAQNNLAWLYATCDDPKFRDPKAAVELAQRAVVLTNWKDAGFVDTLAEAHFANGDFLQAVEIQKKALALEPDNEELQGHMARYRKIATK